MSMQFYPEYKQAAAEIVAMEERQPGRLWRFSELEQLLESKRGTMEFQLRILSLREFLLNKEGVIFMNVRGVGYKVATDEETVQQVMPSQDEKMRRVVRRKMRIIETVNRSALTQGDKAVYDQQISRTAMTAAFMSRVRRLLPGKKLTMELPKIGEDES